MVPVADHDLLEAGAREAAEAIMRLAQQQHGRMLSAGPEPIGALIGRVGPSTVVVAFTVTGGVAGRLALVVTEQGAHALAGSMIGTVLAPGSMGALDGRAVGALMELGNIAASAFMNGVAEVLRTSCVPSVPSFDLGDPHKVVSRALGGAREVLIARLVIGDVDVELALAR